MGLFSAWVLVTLTALAALGMAVPVRRLARRDGTGRSGGTR